MCKRPVYRKTPLGREIADLLLAVNRPYGKSDYIPCICWGRNARYASGFDVGEHVRILGRIQSREYVKKLSETETETRTAYEVSVSKLECIEERRILLKGYHILRLTLRYDILFICDNRQEDENNDKIYVARMQW